MSTGTRLSHSFGAESVVFAGRLFTHWRRYPIVPIQALLFPTVLLIIYSLLGWGRVTGDDDALVLDHVAF